MATPRIHGFGDSHCACILTEYLLSDVKKFFIMFCTLVNYHSKRLTCVAENFLGSKLT